MRLSRSPQFGALSALLALAVVTPATAASAAAAGAVPTPIPNPVGDLLVTATATIPANPLELDLTKSEDWQKGSEEGQGYLNGDPECRLEWSSSDEDRANTTEVPVSETSVADPEPAPAEIPSDGSAVVEPAVVEPAVVEPAVVEPTDVDFLGTNLRVYSKLSFTVVKEGLYTFRVVDATGVGGANDFGDPYLALYSAFDPQNLDANLVGCNDDIGTAALDVLLPGYNFNTMDPYFEGYDAPEDGDIGQYPYFAVTLAPGSYTLITTTFTAQDKASWVSDALGPQSVIFEYWGPECGIEGSCDATLANTGVDVAGTVSLAGLALLGGIVMLAWRRRATI